MNYSDQCSAQLCCAASFMKPYCCVEVPALCTPCPSLLPVECTARFLDVVAVCWKFPQLLISGPALVHVARSSYRSARLSICTLRWKFQPPIGGPALCTRGCRARLRTLRPLYTLPVAPAANPNNTPTMLLQVPKKIILRISVFLP